MEESESHDLRPLLAPRSGWFFVPVYLLDILVRAWDVNATFVCLSRHLGFCFLCHASAFFSSSYADDAVPVRVAVSYHMFDSHL